MAHKHRGRIVGADTVAFESGQRVHVYAHVGARQEMRAEHLVVRTVQLGKRVGSRHKAVCARNHETVGKAVVSVVRRLGEHANGFGLIRGVAQLVGIPVGSKIAEVHHAHIAAHAFHLLRVPQRERVVVAIREYDGIRVEGFKVVHAEIARGIAPAAVMVVPCLRHHLQRHRDAYCHSHTGRSPFLAFAGLAAFG